METRDVGFLQVVIKNSVFGVPTVSTFEELRLSILSDFGFVVSDFIADNLTPSLRLDPHLFKKIEAVIKDNYIYERHGRDGTSFRCKYCKKSLTLTNYVCQHTAKCKNNVLRSKHSLLSETISSIDRVSDDEKIESSSFLSISKTKALIDDQKIQNNTSCCFDTQDSTKIIQTTQDCDTSDRNKEE